MARSPCCSALPGSGRGWLLHTEGLRPRASGAGTRHGSGFSRCFSGGGVQEASGSPEATIFELRAGQQRTQGQPSPRAADYLRGGHAGVTAITAIPAPCRDDVLGRAALVAAEQVASVADLAQAKRAAQCDVTVDRTATVAADEPCRWPADQRPAGCHLLGWPRVTRPGLPCQRLEGVELLPVLRLGLALPFGGLRLELRGSCEAYAALLDLLVVPGLLGGLLSLSPLPERRGGPAARGEPGARRRRPGWSSRWEKSARSRGAPPWLHGCLERPPADPPLIPEADRSRHPALPDQPVHRPGGDF